MFFQTKPIIIEAVHWNGSNVSDSPQWLVEALQVDLKANGAIWLAGDELHVNHYGNVHIAKPNSYILKGMGSCIIVQDADSFNKQYDSVSMEVVTQ